MDPKLVLAGLLVGFLVGLIGVGSGLLLAPLLLLLGVPPHIMVGSDLGYSFFTKVSGLWIHALRGSVRWRWVGWMSLGGVPGVLIGSLLLGRFIAAPETIRQWIGLVLVSIVLLTLLAEAARFLRQGTGGRMQTPGTWMIVLAGFVAGLVVGATSIGAGVLVELALLLFSPLVGIEVVGTGIAQGIVLSGVGTFLHWHLGTVNRELVLNLLAGSIPGVLVGSRLAYRCPPRLLRFGILALSLLTGFSMMK